MKITKKQLRKIIREYGYGHDDPWEEIDIALADIVRAVGEDTAIEYIAAWLKNDHETMETIKNSEDEYDEDEDWD